MHVISQLKKFAPFCSGSYNFLPLVVFICIKTVCLVVSQVVELLFASEALNLSPNCQSYQFGKTEY